MHKSFSAFTTMLVKVQNAFLFFCLLFGQLTWGQSVQNKGSRSSKMLGGLSSGSAVKNGNKGSSKVGQLTSGLKVKNMNKVINKFAKKIVAMQHPKLKYGAAQKIQFGKLGSKSEQKIKNELSKKRPGNVKSVSGVELDSSNIAIQNVSKIEIETDAEVKKFWNPSYTLSSPGKFENGSLCLEESSECWGDGMCPWFETCKRINCVRGCFLREGTEWAEVKMKGRRSYKRVYGR